MFSSPRAVQVLNTQFWVYHLWLPLMCIVPILYLFEHTSLDVVIADFWYQFEGGYWSLRKNWFTYEVMHHWGKRLILLIGLVLMALYAASWKVDRLRSWRWSFAFSVTAMILLPSLVAFLKHLSSVPCPWDVSRFGGGLAYLHNLHFTSGISSGHCFPAGHSSGGFGLFAVYFAFGPFVTRNRSWLLLPGLVTGLAFGFAQELRGAHFISHDLWSVAICWFGALLLFKLAWSLRRPRETLELQGVTV